MGSAGPRRVVISDFDGTMVDLDTGELVLARFGRGDWRKYDDLYNRLEMPVEQALRMQFAGLKATKSEMIREAEKAEFMPGLDRLLETCSRTRVPFVVVSYGLDFCIRHFVDMEPLASKARVYAPKATVTSEGIKFRFPKLRSSESVNLKDDVVRQYQRKGWRAIYVGDGASDFYPAKIADSAYAIKGSTLAELCRKRGVAVQEVTDLNPVADAVTA